MKPINIIILLLFACSTYAIGSNFIIETVSGSIKINTSIINGTKISCLDIVGAAYDVCAGDGGGSGTYDLNLTSDSGTGVILDGEVFNISGAGTVSTSISGNTIIITGSSAGNTSDEIKGIINVSGTYYNISVPCALIQGAPDTDFCTDDSGGAPAGSWNAANATAHYTIIGYKKENLTSDYPNLDTDSTNDLAYSGVLSVFGNWSADATGVRTSITNNITAHAITKHGNTTQEMINAINISGYFQHKINWFNVFNINGLNNLSYTDITNSIGNWSADAAGLRTSITNNVTAHAITKHGNTTTEIKQSINLSGSYNISIPCGYIFGGSDTDYCADASESGGNTSQQMIEAVNISGYFQHKIDWFNIFNINGLNNLSYANILAVFGNYSADAAGLRTSITNNVTAHAITKHGNTTQEIRNSINSSIYFQIQTAWANIINMPTLFGNANWTDRYAAQGYKKANMTADYPNIDTDSTNDMLKVAGSNLNMTTYNITSSYGIISYWNGSCRIMPTPSGGQIALC